MKTIFSLVVVVLLVDHGLCAMTEKQMKSAAKLIRNSCQPKIKVSDELIDNMHKGTWDEDPIAKCYMHCVLVMAKVCKKSGEVDVESTTKQLPNLPDSLRGPVEGIFNACNEKVKPNDDKCDSAWQYAKCLYFENPEYYFLP